jgi:hypothetical protein
MDSETEKSAGTEAEDTKTLRLYAPLTGRLFEPDDYGEITDMYGDVIYGSQMTEYLDDISEFMERMQDVPEEKERGLMAYYDEPDGVNEKVRSLKVKIECRDGELWGVAECRVRGELTPDELEALKQHTIGQFSDGFGESAEQREIKIGDCELYVSLWRNSDWSLQTEEELFGPRYAKGLPEMCYSVLPDTGELVCIRRGESGCVPSKESTDIADYNRFLSRRHNLALGVTSAQRRAMEAGSVSGWDSPAADPKFYEAQEKDGARKSHGVRRKTTAR